MADGQPISVQLPPVPEHIARDTLQDVCHLLSLDPDDVLELRLGVSEVTATLHLRDHDGHKVRYGDSAATTVVSIPVN